VTRELGQTGGMAMFARRLLLLGSVLIGALAMPGSAMAANPIMMFVITGSECVSGSGPRNAEVVGTLRTPSGHLRGRFLTRTDSDGNWGGCFPGAINGGDGLRIVAGSRDRSIVIPKLEPRIDRVEDLIEGNVSPNAEVSISISHRKSFKKTSSHFGNATADGNGDYSFDTTGMVNLRGGDVATVVTQNGNDFFGALVIVPHVNVLHANNVVSGTANNGTDLILELRDENGALKANVTAGGVGFFLGISFFQVNLFDDDGSAVYPVGGDTLTATLADDAELKIPVSSLNAAASTDIVTGRCMANAPYGLNAGGEIFYGTTDAEGRLTRDVGNRINLRRGDNLQLICMYRTGDTWMRTNIAL
jgi:hypothetical protein